MEASQRLFRMLLQADEMYCSEVFTTYLHEHSSQYIYRIKRNGEVQDHLRRRGEVICRFLNAKDPTYQVLHRFFDDNFRLKAVRNLSRTNEEFEFGCLQSVDDLESTYRNKYLKNYRGYVANLTETCDPENELQLITNGQVVPNIVDDVNLLFDAMMGLKEHTELSTLHTDGSFAGPTTDPVLQKPMVEQ
jgi:hypothetical protein